MSLEDLSAEEFVQTVDRRLRFCRNLQTYNSQSSRIYQVERDGLSYVLKAVNLSWSTPLKKYTGEREALLKSLAVWGITHLVHDYDKIKDISGEEQYVAMLKEYAEGDTVRRVDLTMNLRRRYASQLTKIAKALHRCKISGLDLQPNNVIASPDRQYITLIDFYCGFKDSTKNREQDLRGARGLFL